MKNVLIGSGIVVAVIGSVWAYRKYFYVPTLTMELIPDWNAKSVKYIVKADGQTYVEGTASMSSIGSGSDYGKWKLDISKSGNDAIRFTLSAKGKPSQIKDVNFTTKTVQ